VDNWIQDEDLVCFSTFLYSTNYFLFFALKFSQTLRLGSFNDEVRKSVEMSTEDAYRMAMKSMVRWVKVNMDSNKTRVFFTSMSPSHAK